MTEVTSIKVVISMPAGDSVPGARITLEASSIIDSETPRESGAEVGRIVSEFLLGYGEANS